MYPKGTQQRQKVPLLCSAQEAGAARWAVFPKWGQGVGYQIQTLHVRFLHLLVDPVSPSGDSASLCSEA